jgi:hypothetical protein
MESKLGEKVSTILYQRGFQGGSLSSKKYREVLGLSDEQIVHFMIEMDLRSVRVSLSWRRSINEKSFSL